MQAVILCAGKSTRTYPLTLSTPKPLLKIANKTILEHNLEQLRGLVNEVIIVIGYKKEMVKNLFGNKHSSIKLTYVEQKEQHGTGHALLQAKNILKDRFVLLNGDDLYSKEDIKRCLKHRYCILVKETKSPEKFGIVLIDGKSVKKILEKPEKPTTNLTNTGLYVLDKRVFDSEIKKTKRGEYETTDHINKLAKIEKVFYEKVSDFWLPVGYPWQMLEANEYILKRMKKSRIRGNIEKNATIKGTVFVGEETTIKSGSYIEGPVIIGKNCTIGPNCLIRPCTSIGNNCTVGNASEIKNSILMENAAVSHLCYIGDSIIGKNANIGGGTIATNWRHDKGNIKTAIYKKDKPTLVDTERKKFGTVIGDNVHTGANTVIYPGRKIWPDKTTLPGEIVKKDKT